MSSLAVNLLNASSICDALVSILLLKEKVHEREVEGERGAEEGGTQNKLNLTIVN